MWWLRLREVPVRMRKNRETRRRRGAGGALGAEVTLVGRPWLWPLVASLAILVLHFVFFPPLPRYARDFPAAGQIADREIRADFAFSAPLPEQDVRMRRLARVVEVPPVLVRLPRAEAGAQRARLTDWLDAMAIARAGTLDADTEAGLLALQFPAVSASEMGRILRSDHCDTLLAQMKRAAARVTDGILTDMLPAGKYEQVAIVEGAREQLVPVRQVITQARIEESLLAALRGEGMVPVEAVEAAAILRRFLAPDLVYDPDATKERQEAVRQQVPTTRDFIKGERIVDQGVRVTDEQALFLAELAQQIAARGGGGDARDRALRFAVRGLAVLLALGVFIWLGWLHFPHMLQQARRCLALTAILALFMGGAGFALDRPGLGPAAVPMVLLALLATVLFREQVGYAVVLLAVMLLGILPGVDAAAVMLWLVQGLVTVISVRRIQKRSQFYQTILLVTVLSVLLAGLMAVATGGQHSWFLVSLFTPILSVALGMFLLPVVEPLVGICSDLTLLELSDLNHPLLQRMALEAQGTYHHSQVVGQLAEHAARAIDANALLVRVGALFHDIGKMAKPDYYVENQNLAVNKHDDLSPSMSALVIAAHVKDGIEMARRWRLPQAVIDFIPEHHGTMVMEFFYRKALESEENKTVKVDDFRYPGPKPRSRETAVLMLADATEAATRSLARPTPSRIREMVKQIIDKRMLAGELDLSGLTLRDLALIRESFIPLLTGIHHARIAYPGQRKEKAEDRSREDPSAGSGKDRRA